ncbi:MAG: GNAT family N-acetyltransferase [Alphaproteobacteria bacterium]|nr:GNAT family N-acetyltransferase [Alphaproteobacteria bacterium]
MAGIRGKKPTKPAKAARRATRKRIKESSKTASKPASKSAAKKSKKTARTLAKTPTKSPAKALDHAAARGAKSARDSGAAASASKSGGKAARAEPGRRPVLTSVRRPKAEKTRGPARTRVETRRRGPKQPGAIGSNGSAGQYEIRDFEPQDSDAVNAIALAAFEQYRAAYSDWPEFAKRVGAMASLAESGAEIIVASTDDGSIAGAVAYFGPGTAKPEPFDPAWALIRLAVVDPVARGHGLGRLLTEECIRRARRDGAAVIALHTSPIMQVALGMYLRLGFVLLRQVPPRFGVPYRIYLKRL